MSDQSSQRLTSLDALRGFDMSWILGLDDVLKALLAVVAAGSGVQLFVNDQLEHVDWAGFHFEDAIFPTFLFLSGVSLAFAVPKRLAREGAGGVVKHLLLRALIIFVLGVIYSGGLSKGLNGVRWLGVIQRIGIASAAAGILSIWLKPRGLIAAALGLLVGYWLMLSLIPVPGVGAGNFAERMNLTNYLDSIWLPGHKYNGDHDPEGILSTLPAIAHAILGLLAGQWLRAENVAALRKALLLGAAGVVLFALGWAWHPFFPVVKKLWSSSFVLVSTGASALVLALFYAVIDIAGWKRWCAPFIWIGANPLTLYLAHGMRFFGTISTRLVGSEKIAGPLLGACAEFALVILAARFLYKRGIFLRA